MSTQEWALGLMTGGGFVLAKSLFDYFTGKAKAKRDANKDEASTLKILADSYGIRVSADLQINKQWQVLNDYLNKELEKERKECDIKIGNLNQKLDKERKEGDIKIENLNKRLIGALEEIKELKRINSRRV